jgi:acetylornithine deacetylase
VALVQRAAEDELGAAVPLVGVGYATDMRLFCERAIPCVMFGPRGIRCAHAVDERVDIADLVAVARVVVRAAIALSRR